MSTPSFMLPPLVHGIDGKFYPRKPASREVGDYIIGRAHWLRHEDGLTVRQIVAQLGREGFRRSIGSVHADLKRPCESCVQVTHISHLNTRNGTI